MIHQRSLSFARSKVSFVFSFLMAVGSVAEVQADQLYDFSVEDSGIVYEMLSDVDVSCGALIGNVTGNDPKIINTNVSFSGSSNDRFVFRGTCSGNGDWQMFWMHEGQSCFTASQVVTFNITSSREYQVVDMDLSSETQWSGYTITGWRVDPPGMAGVEFEVDYIGFGSSSDSDGDGQSDITELVNGRDPDDASDMAFHFETDGDFESWTNLSNIVSDEVSDGVLSGISSTHDPYLWTTACAVDSDEISKIYVKLTADQSGSPRFFWKLNSVWQWVYGSYTNVDCSQVVVFDVGSHSGWDGTVDYLRIDPIDNSNTGLVFEIDWILASDGDLDGDGILDSSDGFDDLDGDGLENFRDTDSDGDGLLDSFEGTDDTDDDDVPDFQDADSDNDGVGDSVEGPVDTDDDSTPDFRDTDSDGDGLPDAEETIGDFDNDEIENRLDADSDGDGVNDGADLDPNQVVWGEWYFETAGEPEGWSVLNNISNLTVSGGTLSGTAVTADPILVNYSMMGTVDSVETVFVRMKSDMTGQAQLYWTVNGTWPIVTDEYTTSSNGWQILEFPVGSHPDWLGPLDMFRIDPINQSGAVFEIDWLITSDGDFDDDGIADSIEGTGDADGDGLENFRDADSDGDGIGDAEDGTADSDGDGAPDFLDSDSDNDGVSDSDEIQNGTNPDALEYLFETDGEDEGWDYIRRISSLTVSDGVMSGITDTSDPVVSIPDTTLVATNFSSFFVRLKADTAGQVQFYWKSDSLWTTTPIFQDYTTSNDWQIMGFDVGANAGWTGSVYQLRIDPIAQALSEFEIDWVIGSGGDFDQDGLLDSEDGFGDSDGDGLEDFRDTDSDNDGILDAEEPVGDLDGDGLMNHQDADSDGDGQNDGDELENGRDPYDVSDMAFYFDTPGQKEGWSVTANTTNFMSWSGVLKAMTLTDDAVVANNLLDIDTDGIENIYFRLKADVTGTNEFFWRHGSSTYHRLQQEYTNAGSWQVMAYDLESQPEWTGTVSFLRVDPINVSGAVFWLDWILASDGDFDQDGISDSVEGFGDTDGDGIEDFMDTDSDGDGLADADELSGDSDSDGIIDRLDADSDQDGTPDGVELLAGRDPYDPADMKFSFDDAGNLENWAAVSGVSSLQASGDSMNGLASSGALVANSSLEFSSSEYKRFLVRLRSDVSGLVSFGWKVGNVAYSLSTNYTDSGEWQVLAFDVKDNSGWSGTVNELRFSPPDGSAFEVDWIIASDLDRDDDGLGDGFDGLFDFDGQGVENCVDTDSDNDGIPDAFERTDDYDGDGWPNFVDEDSDNDGIFDFLETDPDNDGIDDWYEGMTDTDGDGIPDRYDLDSDGDGISDLVEGAVHSDQDGIPNFQDLDSDDDGIADSVEGSDDSDSDGFPDYMDSDSDNDGVSDSDEGAGDSDNDGIADYLDEDSDGDGIADVDEPSGDLDGDGLVNRLDADSDGDVQADGVEWLNGRDPYDSSDMAFFFETDGDRESWGVNANVSGLTASDGVLTGTTLTTDPTVANNQLDIDTTGIETIYVRLKADVAGTNQFFWRIGSSEYHLLEQEYTNAGVWQVMAYDVGEYTNWTGIISFLRVDPINVAGAEFEIDWILASDGDLDNDGIDDAEDGFADDDSDGLENFRDLDSDGDRVADGDRAVETMMEETVVFCSDLEPGEARLLFPPEQIIKVERADHSQILVEGYDYTIDSNGVMQVISTGRIPLLRYYADASEGGSYPYAQADTNGNYFYAPGGTTKHGSYDVAVTYTYDSDLYALSALYSTNVEAKLSVAMQMMEDGDPLTIAFFGDDITAGAQASSEENSYARRLTARIEKEFESADVSYTNCAVNGTTSSWGASNIGTLTNMAPDLVVLAFGMNDIFYGITTAEYRTNMTTMIETLRQHNPDVGIILVAEWSPSTDWQNAAYAQRADNRDVLFDLYDQYGNIAVVDVGAISRPIAAIKKFQDLSSNDINHPNDYFYWVYADVLYEVFDSIRDQDGDGTIDRDEIAAGLDPADASDLAFHFETDGSFEGWTHSSHISDICVSNGVLGGITETRDPFVYNTNFNFSADELAKVYVRMRSDQVGNSQFYWRSVTSGQTSYYFEYDYYSDTNDWQILVFDLAGNTNWTGIQNYLRVDPVFASNALFEIDWIIGSDGDYDNDGIEDEEDGFDDSNSNGIEDFRDPLAWVPAQIEELTVSIGSGGVELVVSGRMGKRYFLQRSLSLTMPDWITVHAVGPLSADQVVLMVDPGPPDFLAFYRVLAG